MKSAVRRASNWSGSTKTIVIAVLTSIILGAMAWVGAGTQKAYSVEPRVDRLDKRAGEKDEDWKSLREWMVRHDLNAAHQSWYIEQMAKKMGIDPPPKVEGGQK